MIDLPQKTGGLVREAHPRKVLVPGIWNLEIWRLGNSEPLVVDAKMYGRPMDLANPGCFLVLCLESVEI